MAADEKLVLTHEKSSVSGEIVIAPEVIEVIIGIAASKVDGVYGMRGNLATNMNEWLGRSVHRKGISLHNDEDGLKVDIFCYLNYGVVVPKVALEIQEKVKQQVLFMTDITLKEVNIHIMGMVPEKTESSKLDEILDLEDEEV